MVVAFVLVALGLGACGGEEPRRATSGPAATAGRERVSNDRTVASRRQPTVADALRRIDEHLDIPVVVPENLPSGTRVLHVSLSDAVEASPGVAARPRSAQLMLALPERRRLLIQYGYAGFDGCGPLSPDAVTVSGQPAVFARSSGGSREATLVWPATVANPAGVYGLAGRLPRAQILAFAESMENARTRARVRRGGC